MLEIRLATIDDVDELFRLNKIFNGDGVSDKSHIINSLKNHQFERVFIAVYDGKVVGFSCLLLIMTMCNKNPRAELTELFVEEEYRKLGIGSEIIKYVENYLVSINIYELILLTGSINTVAQEFYKRNGFVLTGEIQYKKKLI